MGIHVRTDVRTNEEGGYCKEIIFPNVTRTRAYDDLEDLVIHNELLPVDKCGECGRHMPWDDADHEVAAYGVVPLCRRCWWRLCGSPVARLRHWWHARKEAA